MAEHLSPETLTRYGGRRLSPAELLAADDHLAACAACRARLEDGSEAGAVVQSLRAEAAATSLSHLDYERLEAVVDGTAGDIEREVVTSHTQVCAACAGELNELMALKDQLRTRSAAGRDAGDAANQPTPETQSDAEPAPVISLRDYHQQRDARRRSRTWLPRWAAVAAALVIGALVVWLIWRPSPPAEVAGVNKNPAVTEPPPPGPTAGDEHAAANNKAAPETTDTPPPATSSAVVALNDGARQVTLDANGRLAGFDGLASEAAQAVRLALERQRVEAPGLTAITENAGTLMSGSGDGISFKLVSPIGTAVQSARPAFQWRPLDGATGYVVKVFDAGFNRVAMSEPLTTTTWTPREPLASGAVYSWQVTATKDGNEITSPAPPAPQARFKVIEATKLAELRRAAQGYADSHLLRGVLYARAGLLDDAERELQALLKANPSSDAARKLLTSVRALRQKK